MPKCLTLKELFDLLENLSDTHVRIDFIDFESGSQTICGREAPLDAPLH